MIDLDGMALLSASTAREEGTKQQSTTNNVQTRVSADVGAAGGGSRVLEHKFNCILLHYIIFIHPNQLHL